MSVQVLLPQHYAFTAKSGAGLVNPRGLHLRQGVWRFFRLERNPRGKTRLSAIRFGRLMAVGAVPSWKTSNIGSLWCRVPREALSSSPILTNSMPGGTGSFSGVFARACSMNFIQIGEAAREPVSCLPRFFSLSKPIQLAAASPGHVTYEPRVVRDYSSCPLRGNRPA